MNKKSLFKEFNKLNKSGVYMISWKQTGKKYIGSSVNICLRLKAHIYRFLDQKHSNIYLLNSYNKYGLDGLEFDILTECNKEDLLKTEQFYINQFKPELNIAKSTSAVMSGRKHTKESLDKMCGRIPWNKGIPRTEEEKLLMSNRKKEEYNKKDDNYKLWLSEIHKKNPPRHWLGKNLTKESKDKLRKAKQYKFQKILCLNNNKIYECQNDAAKDLKIKQGHISEVLNGKRNNVKGYKFQRVTNES